MARDIVPRAFACDYTLVADILKRVSPSFRDHRCLSNGQRVVLYYAIGRSLILQPGEGHWFTAKDPYHPMLPPQAGLYVLQDTSPLAAPPGALPPLPEWPELTPAAQLVGSPDEASPAASPASSPGASLASSAASLDDGGAAVGKGGPVTVDDIFGPAQTLSRAEEPAAAAANAAAKRAASEVTNVRAALSALMDNPHPLDILGDPAAYGNEGAISRYHNPDHYTKSLGGVLRAQPWWRQLVAAGGTVSPPACSGPRTFSAAASAQRAGTADRPLLPDAPVSQVLPYVKTLHAGPGMSGGGSPKLQPAA
jgi:hypothetical protein